MITRKYKNQNQQMIFVEEYNQSLEHGQTQQNLQKVIVNFLIETSYTLRPCLDWVDYRVKSRPIKSENLKKISLFNNFSQKKSFV